MPAALDLMPRPDWACSTIVALPENVTHDAQTWARAVFDVRALPIWVKGLFAVREVAVRVLGIPQGDPSMLAVKRVVDDEAILDTDDRHLHFVASVGVEGQRLNVTTAVRLKGWRGRLYFLPVRFLHDPITRAMINGAARRLAA
jgi:hypothetical protein